MSETPDDFLYPTSKDGIRWKWKPMSEPPDGYTVGGNPITGFYFEKAWFSTDAPMHSDTPIEGQALQFQQDGRVVGVLKLMNDGEIVFEGDVEASVVILAEWMRQHQL